MFAKWASRLSGFAPAAGLENHAKTRENRETESSEGSKTCKNTYVSARSHFGLESARKPENTRKHVFFDIAAFSEFCWVPRKTRKNT